jgi:lysophospholipase L1-like esterase
MLRLTHFIGLLLVALAATLIPTGQTHADTTSQAPSSGISVRQARSGQPGLSVRSAGRYELELDQHGIAAWYDLRSDPGRRRNLVAPGARLLEHEIGGQGLDAAPALVSASALRARVRWQGTANGQRFSVEYVIWAGGQIEIETAGSRALTTTLRRDPGAAAGATLERLGQAGQRETLVLYLGAWTGEDGRGATQRIEMPPAERANSALRVAAPAGVFRQPRFAISGWSGTQVTIRRNGAVLVAGQDYLSDYEAASATLTFQYLGLLPPEVLAGERSFELVPHAGAMALSLGINGKTLDEASGLLVVDANLPSAEAPGTPTTQDVFRIPYIQSTSLLKASAATQGAPPGSGVQFVLDGASVATVFGTSVSATIALTPGEHRLDGYIVDNAGQRLSAQPDDSIAQIGYGHVVVAIGDSLTAGKNGYRVNADGSGVGPGPYVYPIRTAAQSPGASADGRNFYQLDNYLVGTGEQDSYYRGYELRLSELLAQCSGAPVFILNDGLSGSLAGYQRDTNNDRYTSALSLLSRVDAYNSHIAQLGAQAILLMVGANDASNHVSAEDWNDSVAATVDGLAAGPVWIAHVPWRADSEANRQLVQSYNGRVPELVATLADGGRPVREGPDFYAYLAANQELFDPAAGGDELHPNQAGLDGMAELWAASLCGNLPPLAAAPDDQRRISLPLVVR